ncbi:hypothetical protein [Micromonospora sp. B006]|uniref:hypothetical protein n=1 Tax=Micromonospora sp. B006 TaxID=2201999 RepID=UPI000E30396F|nr:hypothetical protein [Micromonospora sp. B006]AXO32608.1 hypothetical protein MicB006_0299 [Micromonospora sp. B006]
MTNDPFEGLVDEQPPDGRAVREQLLRDAKRGFAKLRKVFVQRPSGGERASVLADMVRGRQERALDALLLLHALEPVLDGSPLPLGTWAKMLGSKKNPCTSPTASRAFDVLVDRKLITRRADGKRVVVHPLLEDGSGLSWDRPGQNRSTVGKGYLTIPHEYWTSGLVDQLTLPGKAMFLIMLAETTQNPRFSMAVARAPKWYGISERTAERGYKELREIKVADDQPLLREHLQVVADPRSPTQLRPVWHRALSDPYSQAARAAQQSATTKAVRRAAKKAAALDTTGNKVTKKAGKAGSKNSRRVARKTSAETSFA